MQITKLQQANFRIKNYLTVNLKLKKIVIKIQFHLLTIHNKHTPGKITSDWAVLFSKKYITLQSFLEQYNYYTKLYRFNLNTWLSYCEGSRINCCKSHTMI